MKELDTEVGKGLRWVLLVPESQVVTDGDLGLYGAGGPFLAALYGLKLFIDQELEEEYGHQFVFL